MPIPDQENRRRRRRPLRQHAPLQYLSRGQRKLFLFFLKCIIMAAVISLFLFFMGFAAILLLHFSFLSNAFYRRCARLFHPNTTAAAAAEGLPPLQAILPVVLYSATAFPTGSDCSICLDSFQEGNECRNLPACKHLFHAKCVDRWIRKRPTCPVCRTRVDFNLAGLPGSRISGDDQWKRLWTVDLEEGTSY